MARQGKGTEFDAFRFELAYKLRSIREAHNYTLDEMAQRLNTTHATVEQYENGKHTPNLIYLYEIAKFAGVTLEDLAILDKKDFLRKLYSFG